MRGRGLAAAALSLALASPVTAQPAGTVPQSDPPMEASPPPAAILTVDQEALWRGSAWGRRAQADLEAEGEVIAAENDRIAAELEAEDAALTDLRKTLRPDEFRARADAFDDRVQQVRRDRDAAAAALRARVGEERKAFLDAALPVFSGIMAERGAVVVLDRATVFLSADAIDITAALIARVDAQVGAGPAAAAPAAPPSPETTDAAPPPGDGAGSAGAP